MGNDGSQHCLRAEPDLFNPHGACTCHICIWGKLAVLRKPAAIGALRPEVVQRGVRTAKNNRKGTVEGNNACIETTWGFEYRMTVRESEDRGARLRPG